MTWPETVVEITKYVIIVVVIWALIPWGSLDAAIRRRQAPRKGRKGEQK